MSEINPPSAGKPFLTGPRVVAFMFAMGICATAFLYGYWTLHLMPFMPLQEAIVTEFPGSAPRVDGGRKRMHKDTPTVLRIVMKSGIDPTDTAPKSVDAMISLRNRVAELVKTKVDFPGMNFIELHVYQLLQEKEIREKSWRLEIQPNCEWTEIDEKGNPVIPKSGSSASTDSAASAESSPVAQPLRRRDSLQLFAEAEVNATEI